MFHWFGWFYLQHSELSELNDILREGIATLPTQTWIPVIPQILARLKTHNDDLMSMLSLLLGCVSESYPEALVFPMMAAVNGSERTTTDEDAYQSHRALELLESISLRHPVSNNNIFDLHVCCDDLKIVFVVQRCDALFRFLQLKANWSVKS